MKGISEQQINYAIGLNLAVTFSDPASWPEDRSVLPPDTHVLQLLVVHLGNVGENYRPGVPQVKGSALNQFDPSPETYLVFARGDLAPDANGNWNVNYTWLGFDGSISGSWSKGEGPASSILRFRTALLGPTALQVGVGWGDHPGWRMKNIDVSRFGKITGIWEIGPVISLDRWIPDELPKALHIDKSPAWLRSFRLRNAALGQQSEERAKTLEDVEALFKVQPPDPSFEYFLDYAIFYGNGPENFDHLSDEFDVCGFLADQKWYLEGNGIAETYSHPGYCTVTLLGMNGGWAMCPIVAAGGLDLARFKPPIEFETSFIAPDDNIPWNLWWTFNLFDEDNKNLGQGWGPGIQNIPGEGRSFINSFAFEPLRIVKSGVLNLEFDPPLSQELLAKKPLSMLVQVADASHLRVGFRGSEREEWQFSKMLDTRAVLGKRISRIGYPCLASMQGKKGDKGWGVGNFPTYQQFQFDYVRFRYGKSD